MKKTSILIVDDEAMVRKTVREALAAAKIIDVEEAADGDEAIIEIRRKTYDVIICDHNMPGSMGSEVYAELRELNDTTLFVHHSWMPCPDCYHGWKEDSKFRGLQKGFNVEKYKGCFDFD